MKPIIVTCTYRQAQELARWLELAPSSWSYGARQDLSDRLRGSINPLVLFTACSHEQAHATDALVYDQFRVSSARVVQLPSTYQYRAQEYLPHLLNCVDRGGVQLTIEEREHLEQVIIKLLNQDPE